MSRLGTPPPAQWSALRNRFDTFLTFGETPVRDRLIEAVVNGGGGTGDVATLRALATAEAWPDKVEVVTEVRSAVDPPLVQYYSAAARTNYGKVAAEFDTVAGKFTSAASACDPEADSTDVVAPPDAARTAGLTPNGLPAIPTPDQRKSRTLQPHASHRMGLCRHIPFR
jgi:hypothetical protein